MINMRYITKRKKDRFSYKINWLQKTSIADLDYKLGFDLELICCDSKDRL